MAGGISCVTVIFGIIALLVYTVGFAAPYWVWIDTDGLDSHFGIWMNCNSQNGAVLCVQFVTRSDTPDWMRGVQGCEVLGFLLGLFGVIIAAIWVCKPDVQALKWITFIFFLIAAMFGAIGLGIYGGKGITENLHFAFYLTVAGCGLFLVTAIIAVVSACVE